MKHVGIPVILFLVYVLITLTIATKELKEEHKSSILLLQKKAVSIDVAEWDEYGNFRWTK